MAKFCTNCGNKLEEGVNNCPNCGKEVKKDAAKEVVVAEKVEENKQTTTETTQTTTNTANTTTNTVTPGAKSKVTAGLLGIFLGAFGVHNFYLGYNGKAVAQLLITVLSCCVLSEVTALWGLIEGILILTGSINVDANGVKLTD